MYDFLTVNDNDFLFLTETWLNSNTTNSMIEHRNYELIRSDRPNRKGGGTAVYYKKSLNVRELTKPFISDENMNFDYIAINLKSSDTSITFLCYYIPLDSSCCQLTITNLCKSIHFFLTSANPIVLLGDFNLPNIQWDTSTAKGSSSETFLNFCLQNGLQQSITSATRNDKSILDLLICNQSAFSHLIDSNVDCPLSSSCDHNLITADFSLEIPLTSTTPRNCTPNFKAANYDHINEILQQQHWYFQNTPESLQYNYDMFITRLNEIIDKCVPKFKSSSGQRRAGRPKHLKRLLTKKLQTYRLFQSGKCSKLDYKEAAQNYEDGVNDWQYKVEKRICDNPNKNKFYAYTNRKLKNRFSIPPLNNSTGDLVIDDTDKASLLNKTFHACFVPDDGSTFSPVTKHSPDMPLISISEVDVAQAIKKSKDKLSTTPESIPLYFIKRIAKSILTPLTFLFNASINTGNIPNQWKDSIITPIFKKGNRQSPSNYRPIALTSGFCRILESIVSKNVLNHLLFNDLILPCQYGFLPNRSSAHQLLYCLDEWYESFFSDKVQYIAYTDIRKAFDSVSHIKLNSVLESYGIHPEVLLWIRNLLNKRTQVVRLQSSLSSSLPILSGVPQGSVIGPLLFIIYVNDIVMKVQAQSPISFALFADDAKLYSTNHQELQQSLNLFYKITKEYQLNLAPEKCFILPIGKKHLLHSLNTFSINSSILPNQNFAHDLGITISSDLKWEQHVNKIFQKATFVSYQITKSFKSKNIWIYVSLYKSYLRPILEYHSQIWSPHLNKDNDKLESVQSRFTKLVCNRCNIPNTSYQDRLYKLGMLSLKHRRIRFDLITLYKIINNQSFIKFDSYFYFQEHPYSFRNNRQRILPKNKFKNDIWSGSFFERAPRYFNNLPFNWNSAKSLDVFKLKLKGISYVDVSKSLKD